MAAPVFVSIAFTGEPVGNFSVAHGLGRKPYGLVILPTSTVAIWGQPTVLDATNVNLVGSDVGGSGTIIIW